MYIIKISYINLHMPMCYPQPIHTHFKSLPILPSLLRLDVPSGHPLQGFQLKCCTQFSCKSVIAYISVIYCFSKYFRKHFKNKYRLISVTFLLLFYVYSKLWLVRNILSLLIISYLMYISKQDFGK